MNYIERVRNDLRKRINVDNDLLDLYVLLVFTRGTLTTWEDVHDAWSIWCNKTRPTHPSIILFDELPTKIQEMDSEYAQAIKATSELLNPRKVNF